MRAARIAELGRPPELHDADEPAAGDAIVEVETVALNPLDIAIGAGRFYGGHPPLPYIPGSEAVGRSGDGKRVYIFGEGLGGKRDGTLAELIAFPEEAGIRIPDDADPALAVACGIAGVAGWSSVAARAGVGSADTVLVLAATGTVGSVALQAARLLGARRVVAAGRRAEALERTRALGADATVQLDGGADLVDRLEEACGGDGPTVVIDPVWGEPLAAAVKAAAPGARIVNLGQSAGPETTLTSGDVRGKQLTILGHSNFGLSRDQLAETYLQLLEHASAGRVRIDYERFPLERVAEAWERQAAGDGKAVVELARGQVPGRAPGPGSDIQR